jgi:predicted metal-dependent enzyme (double-stranded beta helix superfamily)/rhodanese-related sulfurtransferase
MIQPCMAQDESMSLPNNPCRLRNFLGELSALLSLRPAETSILQQGANLLAELVKHDDWLPEAFAQPDPQRYQQYLLHTDAEQRFSVVSFVWGPGQSTPVHDHRVWGLIGMLRGAEISQRYGVTSAGLQYVGSAVRLERGQVEAVSPGIGDIHQVSNAYDDRVSISIHVYGANIGAVRRAVYQPDGSQKAFISGYSNTPAPEYLGPVQREPFSMSHPVTRSFADIRKALLARQELALIDVREEAPFAEEHPLFAANIPLSKLELEIYARVPRRTTAITVYDEGEGLAEVAVRRLIALGYEDVALLEGGLTGWRDAGGELFRDVNVPSKAFGELVESQRHTPSLAAEEVKALLDAKADVVVLDARRFDEYQTMNIPGSISVPGAELVLRVRELAPSPNTRVIVNCAGRTRSIIGTQSLVNAGIPNPVAALRNGTIGWTLAGQQLEHGQDRRFDDNANQSRSTAAPSARAVADKARVGRASLADLRDWQQDSQRTTYLFDVRTPEEFEAGHLPCSRSTPGGQLVQETDHVASVRGARIVLVDDDGVRANMSASWLAQMGWEVHVLDGLHASAFSEKGAWQAPLPALPQPAEIDPQTLAAWQAEGDTVLLDFTTSANYVKRHIPGAYWALRAQLPQALEKLPVASRYVVTCGSSLLARFVVDELRELTDKPVFLLAGGTAAWIAADLPLEEGETRLAVPRSDRYRRPYEGTDNPREAMQGYLDWEFGLVEQLSRDGTHGFYVI